MKGLALQSFAHSQTAVGNWLEGKPGPSSAARNGDNGRLCNSVTLRGKCRNLFVREEQWSGMGRRHSRESNVRYQLRETLAASKRVQRGVQAMSDESASGSVDTKAETTSTSTASSSGSNGAVSSGTVPVTFSLPRRCEWGQAFYVVGEADALGAWNLDKAVPLNWTEGHVWTATIDLAVGTSTEFKYVLVGKRGYVEWQPGPNARVDAPAGSVAPISVQNPWTADEAPFTPPTVEEQEKEKEEAYEMLTNLTSTVKIKVAMESFEEEAARLSNVGSSTRPSEPQLEEMEDEEDYDLEDQAVDTPTNAEAKIEADSDESDAHSDAEVRLEAELASLEKTAKKSIASPPSSLTESSSTAGAGVEEEEENKNGAPKARTVVSQKGPFEGGFLAKDAQLVRQVFARLLGSLGRQTLMDEEVTKAKGK